MMMTMTIPPRIPITWYYLFCSLFHKTLTQGGLIAEANDIPLMPLSRYNTHHFREAIPRSGRSRYYINLGTGRGRDVIADLRSAGDRRSKSLLNLLLEERFTKLGLGRVRQR